MNDVTHNVAEKRFEVANAGGQPAILEYEIHGRKLALTHTEVPKLLEGRGIGTKLVEAALKHARAEGLIVLPICPFVGAYIQRHPEYADVVSEQFRDRLRQNKSAA